MLFLLATGYCFLASLEKKIIGEEGRAGADAGVRDVKDGPVIRACVREYEIYHVAESRAVRHVAQNAREQQRASAEHSVIIARRAKEINEDGDSGGSRERDEEPAPEVASILQLTERDAAILRVDHVQHPADNRFVLAVTQDAHGPGLARLVHHVDAEGRAEISRAPADALRFHSTSPRSSFKSTGRQRSQAVG